MNIVSKTSNEIFQMTLIHMKVDVIDVYYAAYTLPNTLIATVLILMSLINRREKKSIYYFLLRPHVFVYIDYMNENFP